MLTKASSVPASQSHPVQCAPNGAIGHFHQSLDLFVLREIKDGEQQTFPLAVEYLHSHLPRPQSN